MRPRSQAVRSPRADVLLPHGRSSDITGRRVAKWAKSQGRGMLAVEAAGTMPFDRLRGPDSPSINWQHVTKGDSRLPACTPERRPPLQPVSPTPKLNAACVSTITTEPAAHAVRKGSGCTPSRHGRYRARGSQVGRLRAVRLAWGACLGTPQPGIGGRCIGERLSSAGAGQTRQR